MQVLRESAIPISWYMGRAEGPVSLAVYTEGEAVVKMDKAVWSASRRSWLGLMGAGSLGAVVPLGNSALAGLLKSYGHGDITLQRSREGRALSRARYHRALSFMPYPGMDHDAFFYQAGIVVQLGLSAHLLDVGFADAWCARHVGLRVASTLAYARATGLDVQSGALDRLAAVLSPYSQWNTPQDNRCRVDDGGFSQVEVISVLTDLLEAVREATGHGRPRGWMVHSGSWAASSQPTALPRRARL